MERHNVRKFTHFVSLPLTSEGSKSLLRQYQSLVNDCFKSHEQKALQPNNPNIFHVTICMLSLDHEAQIKTKAICDRLAPQIQQLLEKVELSFTGLGYFQSGSKPHEGINVLYLDIAENEAFARLLKVADLLIKNFVDEQILLPEDFRPSYLSYDEQTKCYKPDKLHVTMFYVSDWKGVTFREAVESAREIKVTQRLPVTCVDVSTRFEYDSAGYYQPLVRIRVSSK